MGDEVTESNQRGTAITSVWQAACKDCHAERSDFMRQKQSGKASGSRKDKKCCIGDDTSFEYSSDWACRMLNRGNTRSDRCERHRRAHKQAIQALAVPYIDLQTIGEVEDPRNPSGPLGGLGPLPVLHEENSVEVDLNRFEFGMGDEDILHIIDGLKEKRVAVIEAGTGTGKSTFMPFRLMKPPKNALLRLSELGPIIVTEPRRAAATGVARFVGEELCFKHDSRVCSQHIGPGFPVGYQVSGEKNWDSACDLIYVTDGTMINWVRDGRLSKIGTVIIDEAHERSENIDIILAQLRDSIRNYKHLRVIITSATLDKEFFVEYFGGSEQVFHHYVPAKKSFGYGVPLFIDQKIDETTIESGLEVPHGGKSIDGEGALKLDGWVKWGPEQENYPVENLHKTTSELHKIRCIDQIPVEMWKERMPSSVAKQIIAIAEMTEWGDILGFLPTSESIRLSVREIKEGLKAKGLKFDVYPLLSTTPKEISEKAIAARSRGEKRKIVVSSNLAETSLTVKGVRYVVDSGLICQSEWDPDIASGSYPTKSHSQSGLRQRWGRVGRDAPGWVFPLYTLEQFLSLPKNTPPGSTQINLEAFYMKLISAGLDPDETSLPANFVHESVSYDQEALNYISTFNKESLRARNALSKNGAVDHDGHLTEFGREIGRFPGEASHALAIMLADQLACVHEVALALEVLGQGRLLGKDKECILRINRDWPIAWRVRAAQCHRALAIGCEDDLDVLLRICALWQRAEDSKSWCDTWWVNETTLEDAWSSTMGLLEPLSAAMKGNAYRPIMPILAGRARAVLTRAMASLHYENVGEDMFRPVGVDDTDEVMLSRNRLVDPSERIIAFNRFRPAMADDGSPRTAIISHTVNILGWAMSDEPGSDDMGLELILRVATHLHDNGASLEDEPDALSGLRAYLPVGAIIDFEVKETPNSEALITKVEVVEDAFSYPGEDVVTEQQQSLRGNSSGFDRDWDILEHSDAEIPDEEVAQQLLDPAAMESNDEFSSKKSDASPDKESNVVKRQVATALPDLHIATNHGSDFRSKTNRAIIVGYKTISENAVTLLVDLFDDNTIGGDPAKHEDLEYGQEISVHVCGVVRDHEWGYVQLARADLRGYFYLNANEPGLNIYDNTFLQRLQPRAMLAGRIVAQDDNPITVTLLDGLRDHLSKAPVEKLNVGGKLQAFYSSKVIEEPNQWGKVLVELDHKDVERGIYHRFEIRVKDIKCSGIAQPEVGQNMLVALEPGREKKRKSLKVNKKLLAFVDKHSDCLELSGNIVQVTRADLPLDVIHGLARLNNAENWRQEVWDFYTDSLHYFVRYVRSQKVSRRIDIPPHIISLLRERKREMQEHFGVNIRIENSSNQVEITSLNEVEVEKAKELFHIFLELPRITGVLPPDTVGMVLGKEHRNKKRLEELAGIHWVWVVGNRVSVIGASAKAANNAVRDIRRTAESATGYLTVPSGKQRFLIGTKGVRIKQLCESSGCRANKVGDGATWQLEGPTKGSVKKFIQLATGIVPGSKGGLENVYKLKIVEDTTSLKSALFRVALRLTTSTLKR